MCHHRHSIAWCDAEHTCTGVCPWNAVLVISAPLIKKTNEHEYIPHHCDYFSPFYLAFKDFYPILHLSCWIIDWFLTNVMLNKLSCFWSDWEHSPLKGNVVQGFISLPVDFHIIVDKAQRTVMRPLMWTIRVSRVVDWEPGIELRPWSRISSVIILRASKTSRPVLCLCLLPLCCVRCLYSWLNISSRWNTKVFSYGVGGLHES